MKKRPPATTDVRVWYVYLARCGKDGSLYCGTSPNPPRRVAAHDAGRGARYTRGRGPVTLAWVSRPMTHGDALREEWRVKRLPRAGKLKLAAEWTAEGGET